MSTHAIDAVSLSIMWVSAREDSILNASPLPHRWAPVTGHMVVSHVFRTLVGAVPARSRRTAE